MADVVIQRQFFRQSLDDTAMIFAPRFLASSAASIVVGFMPMLWKIMSRSFLAHLIVSNEAVAVAGRALDLQILQRLAHRADVVPHDGVDVGQSAGAEKHLKHHHAGVPPPP